MNHYYVKDWNGWDFITKDQHFELGKQLGATLYTQLDCEYCIADTKGEVNKCPKEPRRCPIIIGDDPCKSAKLCKVHIVNVQPLQKKWNQTDIGTYFKSKKPTNKKVLNK